MMITTCRILWIPVAGAILILTTDDDDWRFRMDAGTRARHGPPARAGAPLKRYPLAHRAGLDLPAERLGVAGYRERGGAAQRDRGTDRFDDHPAGEPTGGGVPVAVGADRAGAEHEAVAPAGERAGPRDRVERALTGESAPQHDRDAAAVDAVPRPDELPEHPYLPPGREWIRRGGDRQALGERKPRRLRG